MQIKQQILLKKQSKQSIQKTNICKVCFGKIEDGSLHSLLCKNLTICNKCFNGFNPVFREFNVEGIRALTIFDYDEKIKEKLYQFKGCFDYELANIFLEYFYPYLRHKFYGYILVPAPSFSEADKERGFNHVIEIFRCLNLPIENCIKKTENIKQSDQSADDRKKIGDYLEILDVNFTKKKVLICDDVFTTGSTVKAMAKLIENKGAKKIKILVMSKTKDAQNS